MYFCFERNVYTALLGKFSVTSSMQMKSRKGTASYTGRLRQVLSMCELFMFFQVIMGYKREKTAVDGAENQRGGFPILGWKVE